MHNAAIVIPLTLFGENESQPVGNTLIAPGPSPAGDPESSTVPTVETFNGQPVLSFPLSSRRSWSFGVYKARLILEYWHAVKQFADDPASCPASWLAGKAEDLAGKAPAVSSYKDQPVLSFPLSRKYSFSFGQKKARQLADHLNIITAFAAANYNPDRTANKRPAPADSPAPAATTDQAPENPGQDQAPASGIITSDQIEDFSRNDVTKIIRNNLKIRSGKAWSVRGGRGTGSGWITISAPPARRTDNHYTSPEDCAKLGELLGKGMARYTARARASRPAMIITESISTGPPASTLKCTACGIGINSGRGSGAGG